MIPLTPGIETHRGLKLCSRIPNSKYVFVESQTMSLKILGNNVYVIYH